jgi:hypothetical protein
LERRTGRPLSSMLAATALSLVALLVVAVYEDKLARAHYIDGDSVVGGNIRYADGPDFKYKHARYWAVKEWNTLRRVPILKDTASTDRDLEFKQYYAVSFTQAYYDARPSDVDKIWFNRYRMDKFSTYDREAVAVHELGHALRLGHTPTTTYWKKRSIMFWDAKATPWHRPQRHDKSDYRRIW